MIALDETLQVLGLAGKHFSLAKKVGGKLLSGCFPDVQSAERWLGDGGTDSYICGNPVRPGTTGKPTDADIESVRVLLVDCDPKKDSEHDPDGTTQERMDAAWTLASAIWEHFEQKGVLVASGRGAQVWLRVEFGVDRRALLAWIRDEFRDPLVDIDATHDYSRLMRLPNTVNTRTGDLVCLVDPGLDSAVSASDVRDLLASWAPPVALSLPDADRTAPSGREVRRYVVGKALELWREDPFEITTDRSRRDFLFLRAVLERGAPLDAASRLLHALGGSKANERTDEGYWVSTATAALTSLADERSACDVLANVVARAESDPDYLLQPETLKALARVYVQDHEAWLTLRGKLKPIVRSAGIGIGDLDKVVKRRAAERITEEQVPPDGVVIFARAEDGGKGAWKMRDSKGKWTWAGMQEVLIVLAGAGEDPESASALAMVNPFSVSLEPFAPRILPGRVWNESNARFACEPKEGPFPMWEQLYNVVGRGLDNDLKGSGWARDNGVTTGGQYLTLWSASMLQAPRSRRAYLALFSPEQGAGKSLFFEAHRFLIGKALVKGNAALTNDRFNGELQGAVLVYTEEIDLGHGGRSKVYDKVKDLTLSVSVTIEAKNGQPFEVPNVMSFGQCSNSQSYCPVFDGDDRVTLFQVLPPEDSERIPKDVMLAALEAEAPAFLAHLLKVITPSTAGRYVIPPIPTEVKETQQRANQTDLSDWLGKTPEWVLWPMERVIDSFRASLTARDLPTKFWSPQRIRRDLPFEGCRTRALWERLQNEIIEGETATEIKDRLGLIDPTVRLGRSLSALSKVAPELQKKTVRGSVVYSLGWEF